MISVYLKESLKYIDELIDITNIDIIDIKKANSQEIFKRAKIKEDLLKAFEQQKQTIDNKLLDLIKANPNRSLEQLLPENDNQMLGELKNKLMNLKNINKRYARLVVGINEFYASLMDQMFPKELDGYEKTNPKRASFLKVLA